MLDIKSSNIKMLYAHFAKSDLINRLIYIYLIDTDTIHQRYKSSCFPQPCAHLLIPFELGQISLPIGLLVPQSQTFLHFSLILERFLCTSRLQKITFMIILHPINIIMEFIFVGIRHLMPTTWVLNE